MLGETFQLVQRTTQELEKEIQAELIKRSDAVTPWM